MQTPTWRFPWVAGLIAVALVAAGLVYAVVQVLTGDDAPDSPGGSSASASPTAGETSTAAGGSLTTELSMPPSGSGRCMVPTPELLGAKELAFEGSVASVDGRHAVLEPTEVYAGDPAERVTVTSLAVDPKLIEGTFTFETGRTYLVSAEGGLVSVCGFSGPETPQLQRLYEEAFQG